MRGLLRYEKKKPYSKRWHDAQKISPVTPKQNQIQPTLEYTFLKELLKLAWRISQKSLVARKTQNKAHLVSALSSRVCKYNKDETYTVLVLVGRLTEISTHSESTLYGYTRISQATFQCHVVTRGLGTRPNNVQLWNETFIVALHFRFHNWFCFPIKMWRACALVLVIAVLEESCASSNRPGGLTDVRDATPEVQEIADVVSDVFHRSK